MCAPYNGTTVIFLQFFVRQIESFDFTSSVRSGGLSVGHSNQHTQSFTGKQCLTVLYMPQHGVKEARPHYARVYGHTLWLWHIIHWSMDTSYDCVTLYTGLWMHPMTVSHYTLVYTLVYGHVTGPRSPVILEWLQWDTSPPRHLHPEVKKDITPYCKQLVLHWDALRASKAVSPFFCMRMHMHKKYCTHWIIKGRLHASVWVCTRPLYAYAYAYV